MASGIPEGYSECLLSPECSCSLEPGPKTELGSGTEHSSEPERKTEPGSGTEHSLEPERKTEPGPGMEHLSEPGQKTGSDSVLVLW